MKYQVWKLRFLSDVHFGDGGLTRSRNILTADTVFSALCKEAVRMGSDMLGRLVEAVLGGRLRISDALPFAGTDLYIPKPMLEIRGDREADSVMKKAAKKLEYIPAARLDEYLAGNMDIQKEASAFSHAFGHGRLIEKAAVSETDETKPYAVSVFTYGKTSGLYLCVGYTDEEELDLVRELMESLGVSGIGGKVSSGYGKFELSIAGASAADPVLKRLETEDAQVYMSLSVSLPKDEELEQAIIGAS